VHSSRCACLKLLHALESCTSHPDSQAHVCVYSKQVVHTSTHTYSHSLHLHSCTSLIPCDRKCFSMDPNYCRRSQNEDDFVFFIHPTLEEGTSSQSSKKKLIHNSIRNGATFVHETLTGHEALCKRRFHMVANRSISSFLSIKYLS
jgi:hypothetical protein